MRVIRQGIYALSFLMGLWISASFIGVMFNTANAELWTTSLVWAMLASVIVMPGLVVAYHANEKAVKKAARRVTEQSNPSLEKQTPFVRDEQREGALWPEAKGDHSSKG